MSIEDKVAQAEKLIAEVKAELAEKASKARNWPEKIEAVMCFEARQGYEHEGELFVSAEDDEPYLLHAATGRFYNRGKFFWDERPWERYKYLGMAKSGLVWSYPTQACMAATDAHEPTGAELVGKECEVSVNGRDWTSPVLVHSYDPYSPTPYRVTSRDSFRVHCWTFARLAR